VAHTRAGAFSEFTCEDIKSEEFFGEGAGIAVRLDDDDLRRDFDEALKAIDQGT
jgi:polar amino acid transport system substrate-binding protein